MKYMTGVALLAAVLMVGCTPPTSGASGGGNDDIAKTATLTVSASIQEGDYAIAAVVTPYTAKSIHHLLLKVYTVTDGSEQAFERPDGTPLVAELPGSDLDKTVTLDLPASSKRYRVRAFAYKAAGMSDADLISTSDESSMLDVTLAEGDRKTATLPVKLIDVPFDGHATGPGLDVTDGGLDTHGPETAE